MSYSFVLMNAGQDIATKEEMSFEADDAAIRHARQFLWAWTYEIWAGNRLVAQAAPDATYGHALELRIAA